MKFESEDTFSAVTFLLPSLSLLPRLPNKTYPIYSPLWKVALKRVSFFQHHWRSVLEENHLKVSSRQDQ